MSGKHVNEAARDTVSVRRRRWPWAAAIALLAAAAGGVAWAVTT